MSKKRIPRYQQGADENNSGRILADLSKQARNGSYDPKLYYEDTPFVCVDCGKEEIWTANQQQWWYEVAKGAIYSRAIRCRACRQKARAKRIAGSSADNQPIRHVGTVMKLVRAEVEPVILAAGFVFEARNKPRHPGERVWIDFKRNGQLLSIAFERPPRLVAELLEVDGDCRIVAAAKFDRPRTRADVLATIKVFVSAVTEVMPKLRPNSTALACIGPQRTI